jgi:integrase
MGRREASGRGRAMPEPFTKKTLDTLAAEARGNPAAKTRCVYDSAVPGFMVRLRGGRLDFWFSYRRHGRERRVSLGRYGATTLDGAREAARELYGKVKAGGDPAEERKASRERLATFAELSAAYLRDLEERAEGGAKRGRRSTVQEFRRLLEKLILPKLGRLEVAAVGLEHVEGLHRALWKTPSQANRALTLCSAVLSFAERRGLRPRGSNPCEDVTRAKERERRTRLTLAELQCLGAAIRAAETEGTENPSTLLALKLLAVVGCRRSEILSHALKGRRPDGGGGLRWRDVDLGERTIYFREAKAGSRLAPLGSAAVALLAAARPEDVVADAPVCPGARPGAALCVVEKTWRRLLKAAEISPCGLHTLRRSFASVGADLGMGEYLLAGLLGHAKGTVTARYAIPAADPLREAAERISGEIAAAMGLADRETAKVLPLTRRTG